LERPDLNTCRVSVTDADGNTKNSTYSGSNTHCHYQRDEAVNTIPSEVYFAIMADLDMSVGNMPDYVSKSEVGIVGAEIALQKVDLRGRSTQVKRLQLNGRSYCQAQVSSTKPVISLHDCEGTIPVSNLSLQDGESLCAVMEASSGGYYNIQDVATTRFIRTETFQPLSTSKQVCFLFDPTKPVHCSQVGSSRCSSESMLKLSNRLTRTPSTSVHIQGWLDPVPSGGPRSSASGISQYRLEVHGVDINGTTLSVQGDARKNYTIEWHSTSGGPFSRVVTLPEEGAARLYAIMLEVHDKAGNVAYARRLVLYDNTSNVELLPTKSLQVVTANPRTNLRWQTNVSSNVCVDWKGRFYNTDMYHNNFLKPVNPDFKIQGHYDQQSGLLPVSGTDNVNGIIKFEIAWSRDNSPRTQLENIPDLHAERTCLREKRMDGETYDVWIRATDRMGNYKEDTVRVSIDHTGPSVSIEGLRGRFGRDGLYVHNATDLSSMKLLVHASDPHSGIKTLMWKLGTSDLSQDVGSEAVGVQRLNATDCTGESHCYCPRVGQCEIHQYLFDFNHLVSNNTNQGKHHREYYLTITATNNANLHSRQMIDIIIDESPPTVGVILEGLSDDDQAEMDFTSSDVVHVRWHGFLDHESGILLYRVALADRCLTDEEMDAADNATEVKQGEMTSFKFPSEGRYYTTVVAYNGAMEPSKVACSDGITYDTTPPLLVNVSITHARTREEVACTQPDQPWLVNSNMTRVRLARTSDCLNFCSSNSTNEDVSHLPISSNHTLVDEISDHFCRTLPKMTEDSYIALPSDYLKLTWAAVDAESEMEEYHVGMGRDRTTASAPDLLPFTPTNGHHSYHARHSGLGHGAVFFIFLRALSKAGLHVQLTLGPVMTDVTPPEVRQPLTAAVDEDFLSVSWNESAFVDPEQPVGLDFDVAFRIGYDSVFITPFLTVPASSLATCQKSNVTGCARYPISALYAHDTESGRSFFFQLHVTNVAGHVTSVNTSAVRLPAHFAPSHAVIIDVIKPQAFDNGSNGTTTLSDNFDGIPDDVDVILQREEVCVAWNGLYHEDEVDVEVGIGTNTTQDDLVPFLHVQNESLACINVSSLPLYTKLFSVVRATTPGGSAVFSSDGFVMIPADDSTNAIEVFSGTGCTEKDSVGSGMVASGTDAVDLNAIVSVSIHPGDILFVRFTPFIRRVVFPDAVLLQTTLTGYQVVSKSSNLAAVLPAPVGANATVEVMTCVKDATILPISGSHVRVTWELTGPWAKFASSLKVKVIDNTCLQASQKKDKYKNQYCLLDETRVGPREREAKLRAQNLIQDHEYIAAVAVCFDDACLPPIKSAPVTFSSTQRSVLFNRSTVISQSSEDIEVGISAEIIPFPSLKQNSSSVFMWVVARDRYATVPVTEWFVGESRGTNMEVIQRVNHTGAGQGSLYVCLQPVFPWRADNPTCHRLVRPGNINHVDPFHVIELPHTTLRQTDFGDYLHSHQLGSKLHELYDLDLDFARSDTMLSAVVTDSAGKDITWFLMTDCHVPVDGACAGDADCVTSQANNKGTVLFSRGESRLRDGHVYFICARLSSKSGDQGNQHAAATSDVCGDGVVIDDTPPVGGSVTIGNAQSGYLADNSHVMVMWTGFSDVEKNIPEAEITLNYSVALGSYPGGEDLSHFVSVGQRTTWTFQHLNIATGATCIATVRAQDRVGHVTEVWSDSVIIDNTPPTVGHVAAGATTRDNFVPGPELVVRWDGVEDNESGIKLMESTNGAGLTTLTSSEPFIMDSSPPGPGQVWNSAPNTSDHKTYSSDVGVYRVYWAGFSDPHSGLDYYRVGLGSQPGHTDIHPFVYVGLQTYFTWKSDLEQGKKYYATVEACNKAGLCRVTSSSSMMFDDSPPVAGHVTVGFDGHHSKYLGHNSSLPVQWVGFSDPQTGIQEFWWCVGTAPEGCDVIPVTQTYLSRGTVKAGLTLPLATPLYVTVRARNPAGLDTVSVSDSFKVDPSPPEIVIIPHFLSPRDGSAADSQWDRSILRLAWRFVDPDSSVVSHSIDIRSEQTGRLVTDTIRLGADTELTLTLDDDHLLLDGDSHWAALSACNAAGLCTTSISDLLLVDSTPPVVGTFLSPLTWKQDVTSGTSRILLDVEWTQFADAESGVAAYYIMAGREYNGDGLTNGKVKVGHDNTTQTQRHTLPLAEDLKPGDVVYLTMWAENALGLHSPMARMAFDVLQHNNNGTLGSLVSVRHSCEIAYCTKECTCGHDGHCQAVATCQDIGTEDARAQRFSAGPTTFTTSAKCLEGHWELSDPKLLSNVSRFEWSFSLANLSAGEGVFDIQTEDPWHDVGRNTTAVHCLPGKRMLKLGQGYTLHVRMWLSFTENVTYISPPVLVDHIPPQIRRGRAVLESDVTCSVDVDYFTTEPTITACWDGVFRDSQSQITEYQVWVGTSAYADDHIQKNLVSLNTNWTFPTAGLEQGTRYYVTVRAVNDAGLMTTAVSDGVTVDVTPPVTGVVFAAHRYTHRPAQTSTTTLPASWHGFQDAHSGVTSYYVTVHDVTDNSTSIMSYKDVGINSEYKVAVKAMDKAGLKSEPAESRAILIDVTAPEGVTCNSYQLEEEKTLSYSSTTSFVHNSYEAAFQVSSSDPDELMKIAILASEMQPGAVGYVTVEDLKMPIYFKYAQSGVATAEHVFMASGGGNKTISVEVQAKPRSKLVAGLYRCNATSVSEDDSVTIHQMSQYAVSVCARIRDKESGLKSILAGVGTTPGGLQVRPLTPVGHSGHALVSVHLQHGLPVYATVHAENHAGQWSRFISRPVIMDRTPPELEDVKVSLRYVAKGQDEDDEVWVDASWAAGDPESDVVSCTCSLERQTSVQPAVRKTSHVTPGSCKWPLRHPQHETSVRVTVSCVNGVQIHTTATSDPAMILLRPPDLNQASVASLSNIALLSPFDRSDHGVRSSNSSLEFCWHGVQDPAVTEVQYRFLHESRPLSEWSPVDIYKTSAILELSENRLLTGNITAQIRAVNARTMTSETLSTTVRLDDRKPLLTGKRASATLENGELQLTWQNVFTPSPDFTFAVYAGSSKGYGDVINHVITKALSVKQPFERPLNSLYVIIQAVHVNGQSVTYQAELSAPATIEGSILQSECSKNLAVVSPGSWVAQKTEQELSDGRNTTDVDNNECL
ncbi:hypothetical protein BaRGS_00011967, partial [Batillaria attramentaria]